MIIEYQGKRPAIGRDVYIAPTAVIVGDVTIGDGSSIWFGAVIRADLAPIRIGRDTNIQDNCTLHVDVDEPATIGDRVTIGHNAVIHGCVVEDRCLIGIHAVVLNRARVCSGSVVAAGAVVREGQVVGPNQLVAGMPAVLKKEVPAGEFARFDGPTGDYRTLSRRYRGQEDPDGRR